jgi:hypothetical protein
VAAVGIHFENHESLLSIYEIFSQVHRRLGGAEDTKLSKSQADGGLDVTSDGVHGDHAGGEPISLVKFRGSKAAFHCLPSMVGAERELTARHRARRERIN